jgi:hypothetical protein
MNTKQNKLQRQTTTKMSPFNDTDEYENEIDYDFEDSDSEQLPSAEVIKNEIILSMHHLILTDLTTERSNNGLEPYNSSQVNAFLEDNKHNIEQAASLMFNSYEQENDLLALHPDLHYYRDFGEFLYQFVNTQNLGDIYQI